jgi:hypothetical protein
VGAGVDIGMDVRVWAVGLGVEYVSSGSGRALATVHTEDSIVRDVSRTLTFDTLWHLSAQMITLKRYEEEWRLEEQPLPAVKAALLASGFMAVEDNNFVAPRPVEPVRALLLSWGLSEVASLDDIANI